ncbi:MAG: fumarylacetoacetate hydrolase family protein [Candidatus Helarchaeota archaeon]
MKMLQYEITTKLGVFRRLGLQIGENIIDLNSAYAKYLSDEANEKKAYSIANIRIPPNMLDFLRGEKSSLESAIIVSNYVSNFLKHNEAIIGPKKEQIVLSPDEIHIIEPLNPPLIIDFLTFEAHYKQGLHLLTDYNLWKKHPIAYKKNPTTVIGPTDDVIIPSSITKWLDYEVEFAMIIGKEGKNIPEDEALNYVAGYSVFNDFSARDIELPEIMLRLGPFKSKDFDTAGAMGPYLITSDEIPGHPNLDMECRVNGVTVQKGNTKDMHWKVAQLVSYMSKDQTIYPGTVILSGNPGKVKGIMRKAERLRNGDIVETEIEKIGLLKNKISSKNK